MGKMMERNFQNRKEEEILEEELPRKGVNEDEKEAKQEEGRLVSGRKPLYEWNKIGS